MVLTINGKQGTRLQFISKLGETAQRKELKIEFVTQEPVKNWCWAACSTMIINTLKATDPTGSKAEICKVASFKLSQDCCPPTKKIDDKCNKNTFPSVYRGTPDIFDYFKLDYNKDSCPPQQDMGLDYKTIKDEINNGRPIIAWIRWNTSSGSHVVVVSGYDDYDESLIVLDPLTDKINGPLEGNIKFSLFRDDIISTWIGTYYKFSK